MKLFEMSTLTVVVFLCIMVQAQVNAVGGGGRDDEYGAARRFMIENDLKARDITDPAVLAAMERVPRHLFVSQEHRHQAYGDFPLPIGEGQTISQPYIVALMTQHLRLSKNDTVLEIGTGSGYQAAVLAEVAGTVYTIELNKKLADRAAALLQSLGYTNIHVKTGDGFFGWKEHAPFDAIMLTCSAATIPAPLIEQLKEGGRIILPLGDAYSVQSLVLGIKKNNRLETQTITAVRFVPMRGEAERKGR
ncbi:MAG: protein-L-isoaspartate(D-aspartate) O-methyltransferase [Desulfobacterota bacterium]|nr:protein-L-isoaspartate(D-aspartate) O-methyltransferase [Thermodesulfobacteriota bacterium]